MAEHTSGEGAQALLIRELQRVHRLHEERAGNPILAGALDRLADWQARRLRMTYADLAADPRYTAAVLFFQNDLYGAVDYSRRDADLARVVPMMVKVLPDSVIGTIAAAMELNGLSQELDRVLLSRLPRADGYFTVSEYCKAYRRAGNFPLRHRQIKLIGDIGGALDRYVGKPLIRTALAMMRGPARMAGFAVLQDFLERGFAAFHAMGGAQVVPADDRNARDADPRGDHERRLRPVSRSARVPAVAAVREPRLSARGGRGQALPSSLSSCAVISRSIAGLSGVSSHPRLTSSAILSLPTSMRPETPGRSKSTWSPFHA